MPTATPTGGVRPAHPRAKPTYLGVAPTCESGDHRSHSDAKCASLTATARVPCPPYASRVCVVVPCHRYPEVALFLGPVRRKPRVHPQTATEAVDDASSAVGRSIHTLAASALLGAIKRRFLARCGFSAIGVDSNAKAVEIARDRAAAAGVEASFHRADAADLPLADGAIGFAGVR